jgi:cysteine-S-conjugate beta-lyase
MSKGVTRSRRAFLGNVVQGAGVLALAPLAAQVAQISETEAASPSDEGREFGFDIPYDRLGSDSVKWDQARRDLHMSHIVAGMGIADMDFRCAPVVTDALRTRIQHANWGYIDMDSAGPQAFIQAIIDWNEKHYGIKVMNHENVGITTGVDGGIKTALRAFAPPGSKVLLTTPIYDGFYEVIRGSRLSPNESLMSWSKGRYEIDWDDLERHMTPDTKVAILCNPHNPTGRVWSKEELTRFGALCLIHNIIVIADEIHCDFISKGYKYTPFSTLDDKAIVNNSITFKSGSKTFSLPAMKCAWFFSTNPKLYNELSFWNYDADVSTLGIVAEHAALSEGEEWARQCVTYIDSNHDFANEYIKTRIPLLRVGQKPEGTYLVWLDVSAIADEIAAQRIADIENRKPQHYDILTNGPARVTAEAIVGQWFASNAYVALQPGTLYGLGGQNHMRMNIATSRPVLKAALDSMASALKNLRADRMRGWIPR